MTCIRSGLLVKTLKIVVVIAALCFVAVSGTAQELSPRAYWPAPKGTKVAVVGYQYSTGDVVTDPSLPILGVDSRINSSYAAYLQTLNLWGRTANVIVELPYLWGTTVGTLDGEPARRNFSGFADLGVTLSVKLLGAPTMHDPRRFPGIAPKTANYLRCDRQSSRAHRELRR